MSPLTCALDRLPRDTRGACARLPPSTAQAPSPKGAASSPPAPSPLALQPGAATHRQGCGLGALAQTRCSLDASELPFLWGNLISRVRGARRHRDPLITSAELRGSRQNPIRASGELGLLSFPPED